MIRLLKAVGFVCFVLFLPIYPIFWLTCRLTAQQCPECGSKWKTELVGEWDGEMWECHSCGHYWEVPYRCDS